MNIRGRKGKERARKGKRIGSKGEGKAEGWRVEEGREGDTGKRNKGGGVACRLFLLSGRS